MNKKSIIALMKYYYSPRKECKMSEDARCNMQLRAHMMQAFQKPSPTVDNAGIMCVCKHFKFVLTTPTTILESLFTKLYWRIRCCFLDPDEPQLKEIQMKKY